MEYKITYKIDHCTFDTASFDFNKVKSIFPQENRNIIVHLTDDTMQEIQNVFSILVYQG